MMGRICAWSAEELKQLARARIYTSEDPVTVIDQTAASFPTTLFKKFKTLTPSDASEKAYGERTAKSVWAKFDELAADIQKFKDPLQRVLSSQHSGLSEANILSMTMTIHLGKEEKMDYNAHDYPHSE